MSCQNCAGLSMPICGGPAVLICVRRESDPFPIPAWVTAVCELGVITGVGMFSDAAATVPLVGYTLLDRVNCPTSLIGSTCESAASTNLCPDTIAAINTIIDDQTTALQGTMESVGEEIETAIAVSGTAVVAQVLASQLAMQATQESVGEEIEAANEASHVTTRATIESVGEELEVEINDLLNATVGFNSLGVALPANFDSLAQTLTYTTGILQTISKTNGVNIWTQTFTYTGADLTGISGWVQS